MKGTGGIAIGLTLGNLGFKIKGITAQQVLAEPEYFKEILKKNKMIGFIGMNPTDEEHVAVVKALYSGEHDPDAPTIPEGIMKDANHPTIRDVEKTDDPETFLQQNWHADNPFFEEPPVLISMHMTTYNVDPRFGHTFWLSLRNMYDACPDHLREHLKTATFSSGTGADDREVTPHPALRTHPDTGETMLYWTGPGTQLHGEHEPWFDELREFVDSYGRNKAHRYKWEWSVGDVVVWDNRAVMHGFYPGWNREDRIFQRVEVGAERPFYDTEYKPQINENFGDIVIDEDHQRDTSMGPNPDHIPLVFTKGIYALPALKHLFQKVTMFVIEDKDGSIPDQVQRFHNSINDEDFVLYKVPWNWENRVFANLMRYKNHQMPHAPIPGCVFIASRNGDFHQFLSPDRDLFVNDDPDPTRCIPNQVRGFLGWHPDMRHAGHAWHYPDWFPHQPLQFRPWSYHNCSFMQYENFGGKEPPEDFLVQFSIDTLYGCFNHLKDNDARKRIIERVHDYIGYMLELDEHEADR